VRRANYNTYIRKLRLPVFYLTCCAPGLILDIVTPSRLLQLEQRLNKLMPFIVYKHEIIVKQEDDAVRQNILKTFKDCVVLCFKSYLVYKLNL